MKHTKNQQKSMKYSDTLKDPRNNLNVTKILNQIKLVKYKARKVTGMFKYHGTYWKRKKRIRRQIFHTTKEREKVMSCNGYTNI